LGSNALIIKHALNLFKPSFMKQFSSFVVAALMSVAASAQVSVGTTSPDPSARFEVNSSTQGFLGPRVALTSTTDVTTIKNSSGTTVTPATGLMVYNTATAGTGSNSVTPGYYSFNGSSWDKMGSQPTTIVNGTAGSYPTTPFYIDMSNLTGGFELGSITLPSGKWQVIGEFACIVAQFGNDGADWGTVSGKFNTYYLNSGGGSGVNYYAFPPDFTSGEVTEDALVTKGAVASIPLAESQKFSFLINNSSGADKSYSLRFRESYAGLTHVNAGQVNIYYNSTNVNRLYAVKIQ
jgi:hypothetical protein